VTAQGNGGRSRRASLVDGAEATLRRWLTTGRHRPGDRLPPEHDLAAMLGVSRGTLRTALQRLEGTGEILRRQGSGTFVGRVVPPASLQEGLERLESYSSLARRRGIQLGVRDLRVEWAPLDDELAGTFDVPAGRPAVHVHRVVLIDGAPAAIMRDVLSPEVELLPLPSMEEALCRGAMVLDVLVDAGLPVGFSSTRIAPALIGPDDAAGQALEMQEATGVLLLEETVHLVTGEVVECSQDLFAPSSLDLHVVRWLASASPEPVGPTASAG
jgi:DNA-binding GntR family transcriptional regulator